MSFDSWIVGVLTLVLLGGAMHALASGRVTLAGVRVERRNDQSGYWLGVGFLMVVLVLLCVTWFRSMTGAESARFRPELFFTPYFLYLIIEALRTREIRWGNNPFSRRDRTQVYWTIVIFYGMAFAFGTAQIYW